MQKCRLAFCLRKIDQLDLDICTVLITNNFSVQSWSKTAQTWSSSSNCKNSASLFCHRQICQIGFDKCQPIITLPITLKILVASRGSWKIRWLMRFCASNAKIDWSLSIINLCLWSNQDYDIFSLKNVDGKFNFVNCSRVQQLCKNTLNTNTLFETMLY